MERKEVVCNQCGRKLRLEKGSLREDAFFGVKEWGYFSSRDLEVDRFVICEECYCKWIQGFKIPVSVTRKSEVLSELEGINA